MLSVVFPHPAIVNLVPSFKYSTFGSSTFHGKQIGITAEWIGSSYLKINLVNFINDYNCVWFGIDLWNVLIILHQTIIFFHLLVLKRYHSPLENLCFQDPNCHEELPFPLEKLEWEVSNYFRCSQDHPRRNALQRLLLFKRKLWLCVNDLILNSCYLNWCFFQFFIELYLIMSVETSSLWQWAAVSTYFLFITEAPQV